MKNKLFRNGLVIGIIFLFLGAVFSTSIFAYSNVIYSKETDNDISLLCHDDQLDQNNTIGYWGSAIVRGPPDIIRWAQSFKPTLKTLTKVELFLYSGSSNNDGEITISIRSDLYSNDLISTSIEANDTLNPGWYLFDFPDIFITPEQSYYIVLQSYDNETGCSWWIGDDNYNRGNTWVQADDPMWFFGYSDLYFKTYGLINNTPPSKPIINGPTSGHTGDYFSYIFISIDPDGDKLYYQIDWGDGDYLSWGGPFESNELVSYVHGWEIEGKFTLKARAKDVHGGISDWGTLEVNIPKNKITTNILLERFIQNHSYLFQFLQKLIYWLE